MTRRALPVTWSSAMTGWKPTSVMSVTELNDALVRSSDFGDITMSGRGAGWWTCLRIKWNIWAGVLGTAILTFCSAAFVRKRSSLALECSGPCPS